MRGHWHAELRLGVLVFLVVCRKMFQQEGAEIRAVIPPPKERKTALLFICPDDEPCVVTYDDVTGRSSP
jgi:hypothetical protein